jgi:hypothetical protein
MSDRKELEKAGERMSEAYRSAQRFAIEHERADRLFLELLDEFIDSKIEYELIRRGLL